LKAETSARQAPKTGKRSRRTQERTEITRAKLIEAATAMFSEQGYGGVSVRDIENAAEVQRGLLVYHFGDKEGLWKAVADATFELLREEYDERLTILKDLSERERLAFVIRFHVRFYARHPELSRLMSQEAIQDSWRIRYLVDEHIKPSSHALRKAVMHSLDIDEAAFVHWYYIMVSASATIFSFAPECKLLFDVDSREESMVEDHADMLVSMLLGPAQ
jgi:AcrR family transcriptional regulator